MIGAEPNLLHLLIEAAPAAIAIFDREMKYIAASRRFVEDYRLTGVEYVGRSHYAVFPEIPERWKETHRRCLAGAIEKSDEDLFYRADGTVDWVRWEIRPWYAQSGAIGGIALFSEVITARKLAEDALRRSEERFRAVLDNMLEGAQILDFNWHYLYLNAAAERHNRRPNQELLGQRYMDMWPGIESTHVFAMIKRCMEERVACVMQNEFQYPDGEVRWFELSIQPIPEGTFILSVDITQRVQVESALRQSEERHREISGLISDYVYSGVVQPQTAVHTDWVSGAFEQITGYTVAEVNQMPGGFATLIFPEDLAQVLTALAAHPDVTSRTNEYRIRRKDGEMRWLRDYLQQVPGHEQSPPRYIGAVQDITDRREAQDALRASEEKYRSLIEASDARIYMLDGEGRVRYLNERAAVACGVAPDALTGRRLQEVLSQVIADRYLAHVQTVLATNEGLVLEAAVEEHWYRVSIQPVRDEAERAAMALMSITEITELKRTQQELLELNRTLEERILQRTAEVQALYEHAPIGYHSLDRDGRFVRVNQTELDWLGYQREEIMGRHFCDFITAASQAIFSIEFAAFKVRGSVRDLEFDMVRKDGSTFSILLNGTAVYDELGNFLMSRSAIFDNTRRKAAEDELRTSQARLRFLVARTPAIIFTARVQEQFPITFISDSVRSMLGYEPQFYLDHPEFWFSLIHSDDLASASEAARELLATGSSVWESRVQHANGTYLWFSTGTSLVYDEQGVPVELIGYAVNVDVQHRAEEALRLANAEMARAMRLKDEFLANMSHELRTPLNGILTLSEVLMEQVYGPLNERQRRAMQHIDTSGRHLLTLINDLLDLSKIEAGKLELELQPVRIDDACQASLLFVREIAQKKGIQVSYRNDQLDSWVEADPRRLKQMLVNLLSNAVKFTPDGGQVKLNVNLDDARQRAIFVVEDTGPGIQAEDQARLFQPFTQLDAALSRHFEGTGLGLALVRRLADQHGGTVEVESAGMPGLGSRFTIVLPHAHVHGKESDVATPGGRPAEPETVSTQGTGPLVLLAEDNEVTIETVCGYLEYLGYRTRVARTGPEALESARALLPDLILMDIQLPSIDGLEVIRRLRADQRFAAAPIVAMTALAMYGDRERCLAAGATEYVSKPIRLTELAALVTQLLRG